VIQYIQTSIHYGLLNSWADVYSSELFLDEWDHCSWSPHPSSTLPGCPNNSSPRAELNKWRLRGLRLRSESELWDSSVRSLICSECSLLIRPMLATISRCYRSARGRRCLCRVGFTSGPCVLLLPSIWQHGRILIDNSHRSVHDLLYCKGFYQNIKVFMSFPQSLGYAWFLTSIPLSSYSCASHPPVLKLHFVVLPQTLLWSNEWKIL
jgi:hypothetical protein